MEILPLSDMKIPCLQTVKEASEFRYFERMNHDIPEKDDSQDTIDPQYGS